MRYRRGGGAAPATCPLRAGTGHSPAGSPHHYLPPSLFPKKHFISRHVTVAIANAHALQVPAPTATRRCLGPGTDPKGHLGCTAEKFRAWSGHPANPGWELPNKGTWWCPIHQQRPGWRKHHSSPTSPLQLPPRTSQEREAPRDGTFSGQHLSRLWTDRGIPTPQKVPGWLVPPHPSSTLGQGSAVLSSPPSSSPMDGRRDTKAGKHIFSPCKQPKTAHFPCFQPLRARTTPAADLTC